MKRAMAVACCAGQLVLAQQSIAPVRPVGPFYRRPYSVSSVPLIRTANSSRLAGLIRGNSLYLSAQDAIQLALENNIDIEVARYSPIVLAWQLERSLAGGALPGVPSGSTQANSVASGQGVQGSQSAAGVSGGGNAGSSGSGGGNATVSQVGPVVQNFDPSFQEASTFSHRSSPQANTTQSNTQVLAQNSRNHSATYQQGFVTGGSASLTFRDSYLNETAPTDLLNPSVAQNLTLSLQHNLLQGRGISLNSRNIEVAKSNLEMSDLNFRTTVSRTVGTVLNTYWSLASAISDVQAKQETLNAATGFLSDNQKRLDAGELAPIDLVTSRTSVSQANQALINSQTTVRQQEVQLKNLISRTGLADPLSAGVTIIPTSALVIPATDDLPPIEELFRKALATRSDLEVQVQNLHNSEISSLGTANGLLPSVQVFATLTQSGLAGTPRTVRGTVPNPYFVGGAGTALGQVMRRNFPTENIGLSGRILLGNRQAQADFGVDQLQFRQSELAAEKSKQQAQVDLMSAVVSIQQARARHDAAAQNRILQEKLLAGEQQKFSAGESTPYNVVTLQRDLASAMSSELAALIGYQRARISLDQTTGDILERNSIKLADAK